MLLSLKVISWIEFFMLLLLTINIIKYSKNNDKKLMDIIILLLGINLSFIIYLFVLVISILNYL